MSTPTCPSSNKVSELEGHSAIRSTIGLLDVTSPVLQVVQGNRLQVNALWELNFTCGAIDFGDPVINQLLRLQAQSSFLHDSGINVLLQPHFVRLLRRELGRCVGRSRRCLLVNRAIGAAGSAACNDGRDVIEVVAEVELARRDVGAISHLLEP